MFNILNYFCVVYEELLVDVLNAMRIRTTKQWDTMTTMPFILRFITEDEAAKVTLGYAFVDQSDLF